MTKDETVKLVISTMTSIVEQGYVLDSKRDEFYNFIKEIEICDFKDRICCVMCEEVQCDNGCPFESIRNEKNAA